MIKINDVSIFSQSPLNGSLPNLDVTRTGLNARMSSTFGRIGSFSLKLFARESGNVSHTFNGENDVATFFPVNMNSIFIRLTGNKNKHELLDCFEFQPDLTRHFGETCP